ncbi:NEDD8 ultimate buster 1 [Drosophila obscura]|uniref:NEDD8 ultimate buster 1 n=1 Tax=Drosophila obscura TaxID=7282 RepID=UPI000BA01B33|nr:NEDD8 ultimate buster 1 [Drosophila obscura]
MSHIENVFNLVRARLQAEKVKLWEEPYYTEGIGSIELVMEDLAERYAQFLGIDVSNCMSALSELQDHALRKLAARREFSETGMATFKVRRIDNRSGTTTMLEIKCDLNSLGSELQAAIAAKLQLGNPQHVKCIASGKIVAPNVTLGAQNLKNNQAVIVIIGQGDNQNGDLYERLNKIKADVEAVVSSQNRLMEMEDQDGNPVFLPPEENRALLLALGFCEKAKAAMRREDYEESLLLLLEGDEKFGACQSSFLESVDNFALLNLDIVWCYMCLKNVSQLPDAEARLGICERSFRRSYGESFERLYALKGRDCPERALFMRLRLLQGIVLFHQNRRDEAFEKFEAASTLLKELKVDEDKLLLLMEMGFDVGEARLALRSCSSGSGGNIDQAVQFIQERKKKLNDARKESTLERKVHRRGGANREAATDADWVNPRSVCTLVEMGFDTQLVSLALQRTKNNVTKALDMLEKNSAELLAAVPNTSAAPADATQMAALQQLGFDDATIRAALECTGNDVERSIEFLLQALQSEEKLKETLELATKLANDGGDRPSTSSQAQNSSIIDFVMAKARDELESLKAYERFNSDINQTDQDHLDLPLIREEQLLCEYRRLLEQ